MVTYLEVSLLFCCYYGNISRSFPVLDILGMFSNQRHVSLVKYRYQKSLQRQFYSVYRYFGLVGRVGTVQNCALQKQFLGKAQG